MSKRLEGKVALVTGASKGIGAGIAKRLAADGAAVVVNYARDEAGAMRTVEAICRAGGEATAVRADLSRAEEIDRLFETAKVAYGRVDILVNNAGFYEFAAVGEITEDLYRRTFDLNVLGLLLASQRAAAEFGDRGGSIVNISSAVVRLNPPTHTVYNASKAAVDAISVTFAKELGPRGIRVNSLSPGLVETEGTHAMGIHDTDFERSVVAATPLGRVGQPDDVAEVAAFLASDEARWITGQAIHVSGGAV